MVLNNVNNISVMLTQKFERVLPAFQNGLEKIYNTFKLFVSLLLNFYGMWEQPNKSTGDVKNSKCSEYWKFVTWFLKILC